MHRYVGFRRAPYFNITELTDNEVALLTSLLPVDLPIMNKDLLILVAAYEGTLGRYARRRRPGSGVEWELYCLVLGAYKSTTMTVLLERNPDVIKVVTDNWDPGERFLESAKYARHIMNNIHEVLEADQQFCDDELPHWIWYTTRPSPDTLCKLARVRPAIRPQFARACIAGGHLGAYTLIWTCPTQTT
jgi:hypothetical protein